MSTDTETPSTPLSQGELLTITGALKRGGHPGAFILHNPHNHAAKAAAEENNRAATSTAEHLSAATEILPLPNPACKGLRVRELLRTAFSSGAGACQVREFEHE